MALKPRRSVLSFLKTTARLDKAGSLAADAIIIDLKNPLLPATKLKRGIALSHKSARGTSAHARSSFASMASKRRGVWRIFTPP